MGYVISGTHIWPNCFCAMMILFPGIWWSPQMWCTVLAEGHTGLHGTRIVECSGVRVSL